MRAMALPEREALGIDYQTIFVRGGDRIVVTDALDKAAVAAIARIGHHHIEKRTLLGAATGETNNNHGVLLKSGKAGHSISRDRIKQGMASEWVQLKLLVQVQAAKASQ